MLVSELKLRMTDYDCSYISKILIFFITFFLNPFLQDILKIGRKKYIINVLIH